LHGINNLSYLAASKNSNMKTKLTIFNTYIKSCRYLLSVHAIDTNSVLSPNYQPIQVYISKEEAKELFSKNVLIANTKETAFYRSFDVTTNKK
jgi:hypothetical protein